MEPRCSAACSQVPRSRGAAVEPGPKKKNFLKKAEIHKMGFEPTTMWISVNCATDAEPSLNNDLDPAMPYNAV